VIAAERPHLKVAAKSHPGMSGKNNEDRYAVSSYRLEDEDHNFIPVVLAVVSDGIGGHRAGEVAAEIAVETISQAVSTSSIQDPVQTLREAVIRASQTIYSQSERDVQHKGMGATCACAWIIGDRLYTIFVGDSRIYLVHANQIHQLSIDHTWIQEAIENGALTADQARGHPNAHIIRRYLGSRQTVEPDTRLRLEPAESDDQAEANQGLQLLPGDQVILCSDGLTDLVGPNEILALMNSTDQEASVEALIDLANQRGGHDNITIVALQIPEAVALATPVEAPFVRPRLIGWACLGVGALALLVGAMLVGGLFLYANRPANTSTLSQGALTAGPSQTLPSLVATGRSTQTPFNFVTPASGGVLPSLAPLPSRTLLPVSATATEGPPLLAATLTPWPTNTLAP